MKISVFSLLILATLFSCIRKPKETAVATLDTPNMNHKIVVNEVVQASAYTYLKVSENSTEYWIAVTKLNAQIGESYFYDSALEMTNFESKDLGRTFDKVYFVTQLSSQPVNSQQPMPGNAGHSGKAKIALKSDISVTPINGGITIAELYKNRSSYAGIKVKIRGQVVKVNKQVMGKNWVHIQDGTVFSENFDLTITTQENVEINEVVAFEGIINLSKDFGAGYVYEVIMEDAVITK